MASIPILAVAASRAEGTTVIRDAAELRHKESDRIECAAAMLRGLGASVATRPDGLEITGPTELRGTILDSCGDHRMAMSAGIAGLIADGETVVEGAESADVSFPAFWATLRAMSR